MGLSIRIFLVEDDDSIKRLPLTRYERLHKHDPHERLLKYAGQRVRYALIVVDLVNRRPVEIVKDEFGFLFFDDEGRLKVSEHGKEESLALDMLDPLFSDQTNSRVIDARHKFAKKRYFNKFSWSPTDEIIAAIAEAIFGKFI
jgi:transposase